MTAEKVEQAQQVLDLPVDDHHTVRGYLAELALQLYLGMASEKYGFTGESDWRYDLYRALAAGRMIPNWEDDGYGLGEAAKNRADQLIYLATTVMAHPPGD